MDLVDPHFLGVLAVLGVVVLELEMAVVALDHGFVVDLELLVEHDVAYYFLYYVVFHQH